MRLTGGFLVSGLLLVATAWLALSLQLTWVYSTALIFVAALIFAYSGGAPDPAGILTVRHGKEHSHEENDID